MKKIKIIVLNFISFSPLLQLPQLNLVDTIAVENSLLI